MFQSEVEHWTVKEKENFVYNKEKSFLKFNLKL